MQYQPHMDFKENMSALINFSKNADGIKEDSGKLFSATGGYLSRSIAQFDGNKIGGAAAAIDRTCLDILYEVGSMLNIAEQTKTLEDASQAREFYLKAGEALEGVKIIHSIYSKSLEGKPDGEIQELAQAVSSFEKGLKDFETRESSLDQKIIAENDFLEFEKDFFQITNELEPGESGESEAFMAGEQQPLDSSWFSWWSTPKSPSLPEEDLEATFFHVPDEVEAFEPSELEGNKTFTMEEQLPQVSSRWNTYGQGPTFLGKLASAYNTTRELVTGTISPYAFTPSSDLTVLGGQRRVANAGKQLGSGDIYRYLEGINKKVPVSALHEFHMGPSVGVNNKTLGEIKEIIRSHAEGLEDPSLPVVIPLVFSGGSGWERNHIAVILVKDNSVEYYDAKGILSEHKALSKESGTLRDVLEFCKDTLTNEGEIYENPYTHQYDAHNCGVFVCRYLHDRLITNNIMGTMATTAPPILEVESFRKEIIDTAYSPENIGKVEDIYYKPFSSTSSDDFSLDEDSDDFSM